MHARKGFKNAVRVETLTPTNTHFIKLYSIISTYCSIYCVQNYLLHCFTKFEYKNVNLSNHSLVFINNFEWSLTGLARERAGFRLVLSYNITTKISRLWGWNYSLCLYSFYAFWQYEGGGGCEGGVGIGDSKVWGLSSEAHELARLRRNKVGMQIIMLIINKYNYFIL